MLARRNLDHDYSLGNNLSRALGHVAWRRVASAGTLRLAAIPFSVGIGLSALLFAQSASPSPDNSITFQRGRELSIRDKSQPRWAGKYLVEVQDKESRAPLFSLTDSAGNKERVNFQLPDTAYIAALEYNLGADGSMAVTGAALNGKNGGANFIAWISPDRKRQTVIQAYPLVPETVAVGSDGVIWTAGTLFDDEKRAAIAYDVIRRYSPSGNLLSSVPVPGLRPGRGPARAAGTSQLQAAGDLVGWFTSGDQYVEFSLDGKETGRFEGPPGWGEPGVPMPESLFDRLAVSADNQVVVCGVSHDRNSMILLTLDRRNRAWVPVSLPGEGTPYLGRLLGFDGMELVTQDARHGGAVHWTRGTGAMVPY